MRDVRTVSLKRLSRRQTPPDKIDRAKSILQGRGNYGWLTESGSFVVLNDRAELSAT
jgi:uncharacterized protein (DUF488 family)